MEFKVYITGHEPNPRIINVKQYSADTDTVSFVFESPVEGDVYVVGEKYRQNIEVQENTASWVIPLEFTQERGSFEIQLEISQDSKAWKSDLMLLIVSESLKGDKPSVSGSGDIAYIGRVSHIAIPNCIASNDIIEKII